MTTTLTLAELAAESLAAVRVLEKHGLDYCCGGKKRLDTACSEKHLRVESVLAEIDAAKLPAEDATNWQTAPLDDLIGYILRTHHEYLRRELPALSQRMHKVLGVHGGKDPTRFGRMSEILEGLQYELEMHMHKEEAILFPVLEQYAEATAAGRPVPAVPFGTIANPIAMMEYEHTSAGNALETLRELTDGYQPPEWACMTVRALYGGLAALEKDLHLHIHLENNILFPRGIAMEGEQREVDI